MKEKVVSRAKIFFYSSFKAYHIKTMFPPMSNKTTNTLYKKLCFAEE